MVFAPGMSQPARQQALCDSSGTGLAFATREVEDVCGKKGTQAAGGGKCSLGPMGPNPLSLPSVPLPGPPVSKVPTLPMLPLLFCEPGVSTKRRAACGGLFQSSEVPWAPGPCWRLPGCKRASPSEDGIKALLALKVA